MSDIQNKIREEAKNVLERGEVSVVIGWGTGSMPFKTTPVFVEKAEDTDKLVWNPASVNNLAVYLPRTAKDAKVGIVHWSSACGKNTLVNRNVTGFEELRDSSLQVLGLICIRTLQSL